MTGDECASLVADQRAYFLEGNTRPVEWRVEQLNAIRTMIEESRDVMYEALWHDLRRNKTDADLMDIDYNIREAMRGRRFVVGDHYASSRVKAGARLGGREAGRIWGDREAISRKISRTAESSEQLRTSPGTERVLS